MVDQELLDLKREFLGEAEEKAREIQHMLEGPRDAASAERLGYLAHQLKGAGGSYGYQEISDEAAAIEKAVEANDGADATKLCAAIEKAQREITSEPA